MDLLDEMKVETMEPTSKDEPTDGVAEGTSKSVKMPVLSKRTQVKGEINICSPALKRSRRSQAASSASPESKATKEEDVEDGEEDEHQASYCLGCQRQKGVDRCFLVTEKVVEWAWSDGRGRFCLDCYSTWRTLYKDTHTLSLFTSWIRSPGNRKGFLVNLAASLSLVWEGAKRITSQMIKDRVALIKFLSRLLGFPLENVHVHLLAHLPQRDLIDTAAPLDPANLVNIMTADGLCLGLPAPSPLNSGISAFPRPCGSGRLDAITPLQTENKEGLEVLKTLFPGCVRSDPASSGMPAASSSTPRGKKSSEPSKTRIEAQIEVLTTTAKDSLTCFTNNFWQSTKEATFTKVSKDLATAAAEAAHEGQGNAHTEADAWFQALLTAKKFIKSYRDFQKTKNNPQTLSVVQPSSQGLLKFLNEKDFKPDRSFVLFAARAKFQELFSTSGVTSKALDGIIKDPVSMATLSADEGSGADVDLWFHSLFFEAFGRQVLQKTEKEDEEATVQGKIATLVTDLAKSCSSLVTADSLPAEKFKEDVEFVRGFFFLSPPGHPLCPSTA